QGTLGQAAVTDLAALGRAEAAGFAGGEGRHVVVQHEAIAVFAHDGIDDLLVLLGAQRGDDQRLGFAAREQGAAVSARQHAQADADGAHGTRVAAVDAGFAAQDAGAHDTAFQVEQDVVHGHGIRLLFALGLGMGGQRFLDLRVDGADLFGAGLFFADLVGLGQAVLGGGGDGGQQSFIDGSGLPVPFGLAGLFHQFVDGIDGGLHLLVGVDHAAQHDFFRQLLGFGFHHQHGGFGAGHDQVQVRGFQLRGRRVQHVLAVHIADAGGAHGTVERNARDGQGGGGAQHGGDVGIDLGIDRDRMDDDLDFVVKAFREQRAQRTVDQAGDQDLALGLLAFALEEAAGDLAGRIGLFDVIYGQGKE